MRDSERIKSDEVALWHPGFPTSTPLFTTGSEMQLLMGAAGMGWGCLLILLSTGTRC